MPYSSVERTILCICAFFVTACGSAPNSEDQLTAQRTKLYELSGNKQSKKPKSHQEKSSARIVQNERQRVAVLDLKNSANLDQTTVGYLSNLIRQAASRLPLDQFSVITKDNILVMLPPETSIEDCQGSCAVDTGRRIGAHWILVGEVIQFGTDLRISLNLHHSSSGELRGSDMVKGSEIKDLEGPLQGTALGLFSVLDPTLKERADRLKRGFVFKKFNYTQIPDISSQINALGDHAEPEIEIPAPSKSNIVSGVDFGSVDVDALERYDEAIKIDKDPSKSPELKILTWDKLALAVEQFQEEAQSRASGWRTYLKQVQERARIEKERNDLRERKRLEAIESLLKLQAADAQLETMRREQLEKDYSTLSRLLQLQVISQEDKTHWVEAFLESYGANNELNPYHKILRPWGIKIGKHYFELREQSNRQYRARLNREKMINEQLRKLKYVSQEPKESPDTQEVIPPHRPIQNTAILKENQKKPHEEMEISHEDFKKIALESVTWREIPSGNYTEPYDEKSIKTSYEKHYGKIDHSEESISESQVSSTPLRRGKTRKVIGFQISDSEVTVFQYEQCYRAKICSLPKRGNKCTYYAQTQYRNALPINCITWFQANAFAQWLDAKLPSRLEWEYAASGGDETLYSGGSNELEVGWVSINAKGPMKVKSKKANRFGLYDMTGNLWEWTSSHFNQKEDEDEDEEFVIVKGGSWAKDTTKVPTIYEANHLTKTSSYSSIGFRIVKRMDQYLSNKLIHIAFQSKKFMKRGSLKRFYYNVAIILVAKTPDEANRFIDQNYYSTIKRLKHYFDQRLVTTNEVELEDLLRQQLKKIILNLKSEENAKFDLGVKRIKVNLTVNSQ